MILSQLVCLGKRTVTGMICALAMQFQDWTAYYRLYSKERFDKEQLFKVIRRELINDLDPGRPIVAAMDDTIIRKSCKKTPGVAYRRDPLGPKFQTNLVLAQRFLQLSAALPKESGASPARMIPIDWVHAPTPKKPGKKATPEQLAEYKKLKKECSICRVGAERINNLRNDLDQNEQSKNRKLWMVVDGGFTNGEVPKNLPKQTELIGRVRQDAKLFFPPQKDEQPCSPGRKRRYGKCAPTPEELRKDENVPWQSVAVFAAGKIHNFKIKTLSEVMWEKAGAFARLRLVVIAPLAYRLRKDSRLLYRQPAYLICTDPEIPLDELVQAFVWRWGIEVNHRDEKQSIGVGEAQVQNEVSVENNPALAVVSYALLLLAGHRAYPDEKIEAGLLEPKWMQHTEKPRLTTKDLLNELRAELIREAIGGIRHNLGGFMKGGCHDLKPVKLEPDMVSAILYPAA
jgi:hypothetical protein